VVPVPAIVLKQAAGRLAPELLGSIRAVPRALLDAGFRFADPDVGSILHTGTGGVRSGRD
jgi:NAD dependent epimerase/dehydratase family enzyme